MASTDDKSKLRDQVPIVIGCGPAGLASALGLSNIYERVVLVEKHPTFEKRGSTFGMGANGQKTLDELRPGLRKQMEDIGMSNGPGGSLVFVWWEMRDALLSCVKESSNIALYCGEEFTNIDQSENGVLVTFKSGLELHGDFLIGADGVRSKVREILNLPPTIESENTNFRGSLQVPDTASPELQALLQKGMVPLFSGNGKALYFICFNFHQRHPGRLAWILATNLDVQNDSTITPYSIIEENAKDKGNVALIKEIFDLSDSQHLQPYPKTSVVDMSDSVLSSMDGGWGGKGLISLVGDAAHGMRPTDGYGGSMALEDAVVLPRMILQNSTEPLPGVLRKFEAHRLSRVKRIYNNQQERYHLRMNEGKKLDAQSKEFLEWLLAGV